METSVFGIWQQILAAVNWYSLFNTIIFISFLFFFFSHFLCKFKNICMGFCFSCVFIILIIHALAEIHLNVYKLFSVFTKLGARGHSSEVSDGHVGWELGSCCKWSWDMLCLAHIERESGSNFASHVTIISNFTYHHVTPINFSCRVWPILSHFTSYKHIRHTSSNVYSHLSFVSPRGSIYLRDNLLFSFIPFIFLSQNAPIRVNALHLQWDASVILLTCLLDIWLLHLLTPRLRYGMLMDSHWRKLYLVLIKVRNLYMLTCITWKSVKPIIKLI